MIAHSRREGRGHAASLKEEAVASKTTIGRCLVDRLVRAGVKHVFGVPGDYVLRFFDLLEESPMDVIGTVTEAGAGFAADAYALERLAVRLSKRVAATGQ